MGTTFFTSLAGGMMLVIATGRTDQIAWRFLRLIGILVLALACGAGAWRWAGATATGIPIARWQVGVGAAATLGAAAVVFLAPAAVQMGRLFRWICAFSGLAALVAGIAGALSLLGPTPAYSLATGVTIAGQALGALLIGSITIAWLLGHAYLTATKMTIAPLRHFSRLLLWAVGLRFAFFILSLGLACFVETESQVSLFSQLSQAWLILALRVVVGLVCVGLFAYMVSDCVRLRSTQSATGILYFGSVFAYVGELASLQLISQYGWAL